MTDQINESPEIEQIVLTFEGNYTVVFQKHAFTSIKMEGFERQAELGYLSNKLEYGTAVKKVMIDYSDTLFKEKYLICSTVFLEQREVTVARLRTLLNDGTPLKSIRFSYEEVMSGDTFFCQPNGVTFRYIP